MIAFLKGTLKVALWIAVPLAVIALILRLTYVDLVVVGHNAMAPTLLAGDQVFVWRGASIDHGDVVVCRHPEDPSRFVIGRVVGVPNMSIAVDRDNLVLNGNSPSRNYTGTVMFEDATRDTARRELRVAIEQLGNDEYWIFEDERRPLRLRSIDRLDGLYLLGDYRGFVGEDSRTFGTVVASECMGQVFMRFIPGPESVEGVPHGYFGLLGP